MARPAALAIREGTSHPMSFAGQYERMNLNQDAIETLLWRGIGNGHGGSEADVSEEELLKGCS